MISSRASGPEADRRPRLVRTKAARIATLVVIAGSAVVGARGADAAAIPVETPKSCSLLTKAELTRAFRIRFTAGDGDDTACLWTSKDRLLNASIIVGADDSLSDAAIASGKQGAKHLASSVRFPGIGDLTVYQTSPTGEPKFTLYVFDGDTIGIVNGAVNGALPPESTMRALARKLQQRM